MSPSPRTAETIGFWSLLTFALGVFAWRWTGQTSGLSADQSESLVLARSLVDGLGLRLTEWSSASPGPHNLPWMGAQALVFRAGQDPLVWLPRLSLLISELALVTVALRGAWVWRRPVQLEDALPVLGLSLVTASAEAAALGSGASGWILALAVAATLVGRGLSTGKSTWAAIGIGALCLFRPSAIWILLATVPTWWVAAKVEGRPALRETLRFLGGGLFVAGLVLGFRFVVLGALPPDGLFPSHEGSVRALEFLGRQARWFWAALAGALVAGVWRRFHLRGGGTLLVWVVMTVVLSTWTDSARSLILACVPLLAMLVGDGLSASRVGFTGPERQLRLLSWGAFLGLSLLLLLAVTASHALSPIMMVGQAPAQRPEVREELLRRGLRQPLIAWTDAVEAAALFPDARVVLVTRPSLQVEDLLMSEGPPDVLDLRIPVEAMPRLAGTISPGPGAWWLAEQSPDDDPRCPEGRLGLLSTTPEQLTAQLESDVSEEQPQRGLSRWRCALSALEPAQLPDRRSRRALAETVGALSAVFERQGRLELALRAASLAASLDGEDVQRRARAERLRARWLSAR